MYSVFIVIFKVRMAIRLLANQNLSENEVLNLISGHKDFKGKQQMFERD